MIGVMIEKAANGLPFWLYYGSFYSVPLGGDYDYQVTQMDIVGWGGIGV